jgi:branched-chain amino acid transport system ATP-binding protein
MPLLEITGLHAGYGSGGDILRGVDLELERGGYLCVIGPNGAGKSTLVKAIGGAVAPRAGSIVVDGRDVGGRRPDLLFREGIVTVPQGRNTFPDMTVAENLLMGAYTIRDRALARRRIEHVEELLPVVRERRHLRAGLLSGGQQKQVELARAMLVEPAILLLDEPTLGLEPRVARAVLEQVGRLNEAGTTVLLVEQNARLGLAAARDGCVMELGRVVLRGRGADLLGDPRVARLYLGEAATLDRPDDQVRDADPPGDEPRLHGRLAGPDAERAGGVQPGGPGQPPP